MGFWYEGVLDVVRGMPRDRFSLSEVYEASAALKASRPGNSTPHDTIRRVLQELRTDGVVNFIDRNGHYERVSAARDDEDHTDEQAWPLSIGDQIARKHLHRLLGGGSPQGGICTISGRTDLLLFTGLGGAAHGYADEEGVTGGVFHYVGQGRSGDQQLVGNNRILAESDRLGRPVRVFAGTSGVVAYAGEFVVDEHAFDWTTLGRGATGRRRRAILFHLLPIRADMSLLPIRAAAHSPEVAAGRSAATVERAWKPLEWSDVQRARMPADVGSQAISRPEFKLQTEFGNWLRDRGDEVQVRSYPVPGGTATPDLVNVTVGEVIEAKRGITRPLIRAAIGQVLDYAMLSRMDGKPLSPAILVPDTPPRDLLELCHSVGVAVWSRTNEGFVRTAPGPLA